MKKTYKVLNNQTLTDVAIQELGSALALIDLALANDIPPTAPLVPGQLLTIPQSEYVNVQVVNSFKDKQLTVATLVTEDTENDLNQYLIPGVFPLL